MTKKIIAANWKMNKTKEEVQFFFVELKKIGLKGKRQAIICPPFLFLETAKKLAGKKIEIGAQNINPNKSGAFTGEISAEMLKSVGVTTAIIGHSERREIYGETDESINQKIIAAQNAGLKVIFCIGETLNLRESGKTKEWLKAQIVNGLKNVKSEKLIVAYEPVWAIGTGRVASTEQIAETHKFIYTELKNMFGTKNGIAILYGGSVNEKNCEEILSIKNVDGALVGGASLDPHKFASMVNVK